jgi:hypothetical protein
VALVTPEGGEIRPPVLIARLEMLWNRPGCCSRRAASLVAELPGGSIEIGATGRIADDPNIPVASPFITPALDGPVGLFTGRARTLDEVKRAVAAARRAEWESHAPYGDMADVHRAMQGCLAWNVIYEPLFGRVIAPVSRRWSVDRLGYVIFCWDSFFAASMLALDDADLAIACALETFREMIPGDFVSNNVQGSGRRAWDRSQPPVGSLMIRDIHLLHPRNWFLRDAWKPLLSWNRWWDRARRNPTGLLSWGSDPFEPKIGDSRELDQPNTRLGAALESGLDNSPMYDEVPFDTQSHLLQLSDVGLNALYIADCQALVEIGEILGHREEVRELRDRGERYSTLLQEQLWSEEAGIYLNRRTDTGQSSPRISPTNFYPLLAGAPTPEHAACMVREHMMNPREFWGEWVLPSIGRDDPAYGDNDYWRGRIWGPMNFLVYLGLLRYDLPEQRRELAERSVALFMKEWRESGRVYENYNAETGVGGDVRNADPYYHWGGLLGLVGLIEQGRTRYGEAYRRRR